jgi:hypothetical protein
LNFLFYFKVNVLKAKQVRRDEDQRKPRLPDPVKDRPQLGNKTTKNFVSQNAVDAILAVPKQPERNLVDNRNGHKFLLDPSGLQPIYVRKKDFGNVPEYINKRREEMARAQADYDSYVSEYFKKGALRTMTDDERGAILNGKCKFMIDVEDC